MELIICLIAEEIVVIDMGKEFVVNSLEDMCNLMCDNYIPEEKEEEKWIFTFGIGQPHEGHYVIFTGPYTIAREKMIEKYGNKWGFQYSEQEWKDIENDPNRWWSMETLLEEEE